MGTSLTAEPATSQRSAIGLDSFLIVCEWAFVLGATGLWMAFKTYHPFMNAGIGLWVGSWVARWLRLGKLTRFTALDIPLLGFFASVLIGLWAAPNQADALDRTFLFLGAIGIYYVLANSPLRGLQVACLGFLIVSALLGIYFVTQHPWADEPAKFSVLQTIGLALNKIAPSLNFYQPHPNVVGGVVAVAVVVWLVLFYFQFLTQLSTVFQPGRLVALIGYLVLGGVLLFSLLMTQSRAAWIAMAGAVSLGIWGGLASWLAKPFRLPRWAVFSLGIAIGLGVVSGILWRQPELLTRALGTLPGPNSVISRIEIYKQVWWLAQDTPFTGGGLGAFPGLYSTYVLSVPSLYLTHAHNAFLNILLEQGWLGGLTFVGILLSASIAALVSWNRSGPQSAAIVVAGGLGMAVVIIQGLGDATLVASRMMSVIFFPAGLALYGGATEAGFIKPWQWYLTPVVIAIGAALLILGPLQAQWHADLGAVEQNRVLLRGWPTNEWDEGGQAKLLGSAEAELRKAIAIDPDNATARFRLGLIGMSRQDWPMAIEYLHSTNDIEAQRRGLTKLLGYAYTWQGEFDKAYPLLASIPEAQSELGVYAWWWNERQRRPDLAKNALIMLGRMP